MKLAIIVPHFNPCNYDRPQENLSRFIAGLRGSFSPGDLHVMSLGSRGQFIWQKEAIVNHCIRNLPPDYDAICWIDSDLLFDRPDWYVAACRALNHSPVVQLFETITYLGPTGAPIKHGFGTLAAGDRAVFRAPGGAIAARRDILGPGLYDRDVLGDGDSIFMAAVTGQGQHLWNRRSAPWQRSVRAWAERFGRHEATFLTGNVRHLYHGSARNRQYTQRAEIEEAHGFDPETDVRIGENGLLEWASDKPALHQAVRDFFLHRNEDE